ncbi:MAG TPA: ATP-binding protein [Myxococcales bacterium]|nr:ATP-binding protein [Myxococcales bacterium]
MSNHDARILVVDDNIALLENLEQILEEEGYQVATAPSAAMALERAKPSFDVALVDLRLPDSSGTSLAVQLKEISPGGEIVLLTGFATLETAIGAVRAGAFAYLVKPCSTADLLLTIEQALRQVRLHAEKRELARRAQVAEKLAAVGTLTAGISHEIRNPLNAAGLQLAVLERRLRKLPEELQKPVMEPLGLVRDEIRRLEHLLEDFLQFARPRELDARPVDVHSVLEAVLGLLGGDAERRGMTLDAQIDGNLPAVLGDAERLRQVLMNLALNAMEAVPQGGRVRVSARSVGREVLLAVDDSGPGIPTELAERIFEPFFTTKAAGSGLGLSIVHAIVSQHGGTIGYEKSQLGGARFWVRLPRA